MNKVVIECQICQSVCLDNVEGNIVYEPYEEIDEVKDTTVCSDCGCIHYIQDGRLAYQWVSNLNEPVKVNHLKSDYEVVIMNNN